MESGELTVWFTRKDTVLTSEGVLDGKFEVIRRIKTGEMMEVLSLPILLPTQMLRAKARALSDGKSGWFTIYDHKGRDAKIAL